MRTLIKEEGILDEALVLVYHSLLRSLRSREMKYSEQKTEKM